MSSNPETSPAAKLHFDRWTNAYHDSFLNNAWVMRRHGRKQWEFATREYGNQTLLRGRFRNLADALRAADAFLIERDAPKCVNHRQEVAVTELDGDSFCMDCANAWVRSSAA